MIRFEKVHVYKFIIMSKDYLVLKGQLRVKIVVF